VRPRSHLACILLALVGVVPTTANGQPGSEADPAPTGEAAKIEPPRLVRFVEAEWPSGHEGPGPAVVRLLLTVGADGKVSEAVVVASAGADFDAAARAAAERFEFEPARRGTDPVPVKIQYEYVLRPPPEATAEPEPDPVDDAPAAPARTDEVGDAATPVPPPADGTEVAKQREEPIDEGFGAVAEVDAPPREVTRRTVEGEELTRIPGTSGDAMRAIEVMPGVARTTMDDGDPIIRGAAWNETQTFVHGTVVPYIYHFGGVKSAFNSQFVESVELYPGNYSARYGRAIGGVIDERVRAPRSDRLHGILELSVYDSMALLEAPVTDRTSVGLAARRSNIDFVFEQFVPEDAYSVTAAPLYWDYQGIVSHRFGQDTTLNLMAHGSHDSMRIVFSDPSDFDPGLRGNVEFSSDYHILQANLDSRLAPELDQKLQLSFGKFGGMSELGPLDSNFDFYTISSRAEWGFQPTDALRLNFGWDTEVTILDGKYQGPPPSAAEGDAQAYEQSLGSYDKVSIADVIRIIRPALYVEAEIRPTDRLLLVPGLRFDYWGYIGEYSIDPRLTARYQVADTTALKWGVGLYSQPPIYYEAIPKFGNPDLEPVRSLHTSAGFEQDVGQRLSLSLEGFYKRLTNRIVGTEGSAPPRFVNDGVGRIFGSELSAKYKTERTFAYLAYTLSRSERRDRAEDWRLFEYDQTHILAVTASHDLGKNWELGGRFRLVSGNPYTPVSGAAYDASTDSYSPILDAPYSARNPAFHQLDVRLEKTWKFKHWSLGAYADVQNVYNAQTREGTSYSFDYSERESYSGLPITPNLGIRGEL
jgi:TonB family protein